MKTLTKLLIGFILGMLTTAFLVRHTLEEAASGQDVTEPVVETLTDTVHDTIRIPEPVLVERLRIRIDTVSLPIVPRAESSDSALVQIPIEQKVYSDSTYKVWVSGYRAALDSIEVYPTTVYSTIRTTKTVTRNRRWGLGVTAGVGVTPQNIQPFIGIGFSYNIINW